MTSNTLSEYLEASEPTRRERAENWRVGIGLQKVNGVTRQQRMSQKMSQKTEPHDCFL